MTPRKWLIPKQINATAGVRAYVTPAGTDGALLYSERDLSLAPWIFDFLLLSGRSAARGFERAILAAATALFI